MRAARLFGIGDLRVVNVQVPELESDEVLLKVHSVGVCGSDIPRVMKKGAHRMPITIGHEFSGEIAEIGSGVTGWQPGDRVTVAPLIPCMRCYWCQRGKFHLCDQYDYLGSRCDGALADYVKTPVRTLVRIPDNVDYEAAAMTDPAATALHALWRGDVTVGDAVVLYGLGPIGAFVVQWAYLMGANPVIAVDVFDDKLKLARQLGATHTINALRQDPVQMVREFTGGLGARLAIECAALQKTQVQAISSVAKQGTAVLLGISHDELNLPAAVVNQIMRFELNVTGAWNSNSMPFPGREWTQSVEYMASGALQTAPLITHRFPLEDAPEVFPTLVRRDFSFTKVMFTVS